MRQLSWLALGFFVACGGDDAATPPDASIVPDASTEFMVGCGEVPQSADAFATAADFGPVPPGTLAGWDPDGRWFLTGTRVGGVSSFHFEKRGSDVVVDRDTVNLGTIDDDQIFQRTVFSSGEESFIVAKRVSTRLADGSLRADRAVCDGTNCRICTAKMIRAEHHDPQVSENLTLVGELKGADWSNGFTFNVRVRGTLAYLVRIDGLYIIETSNPANPVQVGHYRRTGDGYSNDVKLVDAAGGRRYAMIADYPVDVVDVTNPAAPVLAATIAEEAHTVFTEERSGVTYAYFGNYDGSTPVYDVTNPALPVRLGRYQTEGSLVHDLSVSNGIAYLNAWDGGLLTVDFTVPGTPQLLGTWDPTTRGASHSNWTTSVAGRKIALHGDETYGAHLDIVDVDPASATFMKPFASYKTRDWVSIHNIMAFGAKAYFTYYQDGVRVMDLSNPAAPRLIGYYNTWDPQADYTSSAFFEGAVGLDVDLDRKLIFVADSPRGLLILRDDTP
ncbi:MAG: hypothetical protein H0T89_32330 [Deltaproteobacteria bacterium]|nr:hypothetical protein [Deltaproteobacteria bacterium]MDQ3301667.1 hypothetical protein [Myxococcota bacterium]